MLDKIDARRPLLIAGPTASGKSSLALRVAEAQGGVIINADALQVFDCWQLLSARPDADDLARARHLLYGHIPYDADYSTGHWLREVAPLLDGERPIIVGGTGLNFTALTVGLADIPPIPESVRTKSRELPTDVMLAELDAKTHERIDTQNPARIRRAWEVLRGTEKPIWAWQDDTPPPLLPIDQATGIVLDASKDWLDARIAQRFEQMIANGALNEVDAMRSDWDPERPSSKAIGAPELMAYLNDEIPLKDATELSITASRQYAKRQRTWFRARMKNWQRLDAREL